jgi:hypothetical protein
MAFPVVLNGPMTGFTALRHGLQASHLTVYRTVAKLLKAIYVHAKELRWP